MRYIIITLIVIFLTSCGAPVAEREKEPIPPKDDKSPTKVKTQNESNGISQSESADNKTTGGTVKKAPVEIPTQREFDIYDTYYKALFDEPDVPEEVIAARIAKRLGISVEELNEIYLKVVTYKYT